MFDRNAILAGAALNPAPRVPTTAGERAAMDARVFQKTGWAFSTQAAIYGEYRDYLKEVETITGRRLMNPYSLDISQRAWAERKVFEQAQKLTEQFPELRVRSGEDIRRAIGEQRKELFAEQAKIHAATIDWPVSAAGIAATMGTAIVDPPVLATMFFAAPRAAGILGGALIDAGIGMAVEIPIQASVQLGRRQFGEEPSLTEALFGVGAVGAGGFVLSALLRTAGRGIGKARQRSRVRKMLADVSGLPKKSSEVRAAAAYLQRMVDAEDASPLTHTPEGKAEHARRLSEAEIAIREGRVADLPDRPRTPVREAPDVAKEIGPGAETLEEATERLKETADELGLGDVAEAGQKLREDATERVQFDQRERLAVETVAGVAESPEELAALYAALRGRQKKPESLIAFLHRTGGIQDFGGELKAVGITPRTRPGFLRKEGRQLDDATLDAWEAGFFPGHSERPDIDDLLEAMGEELRGRPRLRTEDEALAVEQAAYDELNEALIDAGIDVRTLKSSEFGPRIREVAKGLPERTRPADPANFPEAPSRTAQEAEDAIVEADVRRLYEDNPDTKISFTDDDGTVRTVTAKQMFDDIALLDDDVMALGVCVHG